MLNSKAEFYLWWKESNVQIKSKRKQVWQEISYAVKECSSEKKLSCIIWSSHFSLSTELKPWCLLARNFSTILFRIAVSTEAGIVGSAMCQLCTTSRMLWNCLAVKVIISGQESKSQLQKTNNNLGQNDYSYSHSYSWSLRIACALIR